jgi:hypothetical protein
MIFDKVHLLFRIRIRIHNLKLRIHIRIRNLQKVSDLYGSGSTTLMSGIVNNGLIENFFTCVVWPTVLPVPLGYGSEQGPLTWHIQPYQKTHHQRLSRNSPKLMRTSTA